MPRLPRGIIMHQRDIFMDNCCDSDIFTMLPNPILTHNPHYFVLAHFSKLSLNLQSCFEIFVINISQSTILL